MSIRMTKRGRLALRLTRAAGGADPRPFIEEVERIVAEARQQERERVLDEVDGRDSWIANEVRGWLADLDAEVKP